MSLGSSSRRRPVIRIFISSTFSDFKHERDDLQRHVFPRLEELCADRRFEFQAIDLRWGVPAEAGLEHRTMRLCFEELRRAQDVSPRPNFLVLLGNRYGWRPLPEEINENEFRQLERAVASELELETVRDWYREDRNSIRPSFLLRSRRPDFADRASWAGIEARLWNVINRAYPAEAMASRFQFPASPNEPLPSIVRFQCSATEQEIWRGALAVPGADQHVVAAFREIEEPADGGADADTAAFFDNDDSLSGGPYGPRRALFELKSVLRERLGPDRIIPVGPVRWALDASRSRFDITTAHLPDVREGIYAKLEPVVLRQIEEFWGPADKREQGRRELELEIAEHRRFGSERASQASFTGRTRTLEKIEAYLQAGDRQPLVIHGSSGSGKTAILAHVAEEAPPGTFTLVRYIGISPQSSDARALLESLCLEVRLERPLHQALPEAVEDLADELQGQLAAIATERPVLLLLDALDQLSDADDGRTLFWMPPCAFDGTARMIVTSLTDRSHDDPHGEALAELRARGLPDENFIDLDADVLSAEQAETLFFDRWLPQAGRRLSAEQAQWVRNQMARDSGRHVLYLKILFEEARRWASDSPTPSTGRDASELMDVLFSRLEDAAEHGATVKFALGYLVSARRGLAEHEILEILHRDGDYRGHLQDILVHELPSEPRRIPIAVWSRLRVDLAAYLSERFAIGGTVLTFHQRSVEEYVRSRYLSDPLRPAVRHERLARYHREKGDPLADGSWRPGRLRAFDELPYQYLSAGSPADSAALLSDIGFAAGKTSSGRVFDLLEDYRLARERLPVGHPGERAVRQLEFILRQYATGLQRHPECGLQQVLLGIESLEGPDPGLRAQGTVLARTSRDQNELGIWTLVPEHRVRSVLPVILPEGRILENLTLTRRGLLLRCAGGEWMELSHDLKCLARGHMTASTGAAMALGGRTLLLGSANVLLVWSRWPANDMQSLSFDAPVAVLACSSDGRLAAVGLRDGSCSVLRCAPLDETPVVRARLGAPVVAAWFDAACRAVFVTRDGRIHLLSAESRSAAVATAAAGECLLACPAGDDVVCVAASRDHRLHAVSHSGRELWHSPLDVRPCSLAFALSDRTADSEIMVGLEDGRLLVVDARTGREKRIVGVSNTALRQVDTADGRAAVICQDSANNVFAVLSPGSAPAAFRDWPAGRDVLAMRWDDASCSLQTVSEGGACTVVRKERQPHADDWVVVDLPPLAGPAEDARFLPDGSILALHRESHESRIWLHAAVVDGRRSSTCVWRPGTLFYRGPCFIHHLEVSPDGAHYAFASAHDVSGHGSLAHGRLGTPHLRLRWEPAVQEIREINLSARGEVMVLTQDRGTSAPRPPARVLRCGGRIHALLEQGWRSGLRGMERGAGRGLFGCAVSADGRWIAAVDEDEFLWMCRFDPGNPALPPRAERFLDGVAACVVSETGRYCAALQSDGSVRLLARDAAGTYRPAARVLLPEQPRSILLTEAPRRLSVAGANSILAVSFGGLGEQGSDGES